MRRKRNDSHAEQFKRNAIPGKDDLFGLAHPPVQYPGRNQKKRRRPAGDEMQQQQAFEVFPTQNELPGEQSGSNRRKHRDGGRGQVQVGGARPRRCASASRDEIEGHTAREQGDRKMNQHHVLGVLGENERSRIEWIHHGVLFDHYLSLHLGVNAAVVGVSAGFGEGVGKLVVSVERLRLE